MDDPLGIYGGEFDPESSPNDTISMFNDDISGNPFTSSPSVTPSSATSTVPASASTTATTASATVHGSSEINMTNGSAQSGFFTDDTQSTRHEIYTDGFGSNGIFEQNTLYSPPMPSHLISGDNEQQLSSPQLDASLFPIHLQFSSQGHAQSQLQQQQHLQESPFLNGFDIEGDGQHDLFSVDRPYDGEIPSTTSLFSRDEPDRDSNDDDIFALDGSDPEWKHQDSKFSPGQDISPSLSPALNEDEEDDEGDETGLLSAKPVSSDEINSESSSSGSSTVSGDGGGGVKNSGAGTRIVKKPRGRRQPKQIQTNGTLEEFTLGGKKVQLCLDYVRKVCGSLKKMLLHNDQTPSHGRERMRSSATSMKIIGLKAPAVKQVFLNFYSVHCRGLSYQIQLCIAYHLLCGEYQEEAAVGVFLLMKNIKWLSVNNLPEFASIIDEHLHDWGACDSLANKVLSTLIKKDDAAAQAITTWKDSSCIFRQRCCCVSFLKSARTSNKHLNLILCICETCVHSPERAIKLAVGWLLRESSSVSLDECVAFIRKNANNMTKECIKFATDKIPDPALRAELVDLQGPSSPTPPSFSMIKQEPGIERPLQPTEADKAAALSAAASIARKTTPGMGGIIPATSTPGSLTGATPVAPSGRKTTKRRIPVDVMQLMTGGSLYLGSGKMNDSAQIAASVLQQQKEQKLASSQMLHTGGSGGLVLDDPLSSIPIQLPTPIVASPSASSIFPGSNIPRSLSTSAMRDSSNLPSLSTTTTTSSSGLGSYNSENAKSPMSPRTFSALMSSVQTSLTPPLASLSLSSFGNDPSLPTPKKRGRTPNRAPGSSTNVSMTSALASNPTIAAALNAGSSTNLNLGLGGTTDFTEQLAKVSSGGINLTLVQQQRAQLQQQKQMLETRLMRHQQTQPSHYFAAMHQNQSLANAFPFPTSRRHSANSAAASGFVPYMQQLEQQLSVQQQIIAQRQQFQQQQQLLHQKGYLGRAPSPSPYSSTSTSSTAPGSASAANGPVARSLSTPPVSLTQLTQQTVPIPQTPVRRLSTSGALSTPASPQKRPRGN